MAGEKAVLEKTYQRDDGHDRARPVDTWFFQSSEGLALFIVFYSKACRWDKCIGCNLSSVSASKNVDFYSLMQQTDFIYSKPEVIKELENIKHIIVSNNGSIFDEETFSTTALIYFVAKTNILVPNFSVLTLETRPEYADWEEFCVIARALKEGKTPTDLEIAIGLEAYNDNVRNNVFRKGLSFIAIEQLAEKLSKYNFRLKCYVMQKPVPGMTDEEAVQDVKNAIDYLDELAERFKIKINMHLNPTYVAKGTALEQAFVEGSYYAPFLKDVARSVLHAKGKNISVYIGLNDEGLAVPGGSFLRNGDGEIVKRLEKFNATQDFTLLG